MKRNHFLIRHWPLVLVTLFGVAYAIYFSIFTIARVQGMYSHYYDLGIMHQTTYNSYQAIVTGDWGRMLEQTNPFGPEQIKRMAIHTDFLMAFIAPLYVFHDGPETLVVVQAVVVGLGAFTAYGIARHVFRTVRYGRLLGVLFAFSYVMNPLVQYTTIYEFHSVTLATTFLLCMFFFWLKKRYVWSLTFFILSILTKEQVPLTTAFFALYVIAKDLDVRKLVKEKWQYLRSYHYSRFGILVLSISIIWFLVMVKLVIPAFRVDDAYHFALSFYADYGDSPLGVILGILLNPGGILSTVFAPDRLYYLMYHFASFGFISLLSPFTLAIAAPEFGITLLSANGNMRNISLHYSAVITPFVFISAVYGARYILLFLQARNVTRAIFFLGGYLFLATLVAAFIYGPLPGSLRQDVDPLQSSLPDYSAVREIQTNIIASEDAVASTGTLAPHFSGRRYFYDFSSRYVLADYVVVSRYEVYNGWGKDWMPRVYEEIVNNPQFELVYEKNSVEVYRNRN